MSHLGSSDSLFEGGFNSKDQELVWLKCSTKNSFLNLNTLPISDNFFTPDFSKKCIELLNKYPDAAVGLIAQSRLEKTRPDIIQMTPGVKINDSEATEGLGQQYDTPESAVITRGADIIIVGRGVTHSPDPAIAAEMYRKAGWEGYLKRIKN